MQLTAALAQRGGEDAQTVVVARGVCGPCPRGSNAKRQTAPGNHRRGKRGPRSWRSREIRKSHASKHRSRGKGDNRGRRGGGVLHPPRPNITGKHRALQTWIDAKKLAARIKRKKTHPQREADRERQEIAAGVKATAKKKAREGDLSFGTFNVRTLAYSGSKPIGHNVMTVMQICACLLYTSPSPRDGLLSRMPSSA